MKKNQMPLTLKETIVLDGEAGLKELRSLSFEPSVSITEHADHVLIEGSLHLAGEGVASAPSRYNETDYKSYERVQVLNHSSDEQLEFEHYFPITVNVASSRVSNVHQLDVYIDHIDYELKDERVLCIQADIVVDGVSKEEEPPKQEVAPEPVEVAEEDRDEEEEIQELPIRLLPNPLNGWNGSPPEEEKIEYDLDDQSVTISSETEETEGTEETEETIEPHLAAITETSPEIEMRAAPYMEPPEVYQPYEVGHNSDNAEEESNDDETRYEDIEDYEEVFEVTDDQALMSFVSTLEEDMTTIKIHIAQQDETPEMVAERYGVSMVQLMKMNQFESRAPFERGKLIWIP